MRALAHLSIPESMIASVGSASAASNAASVQIRPSSVVPRKAVMAAK